MKYVKWLFSIAGAGVLCASWVVWVTLTPPINYRVDLLVIGIGLVGVLLGGVALLIHRKM